MIPSAGGGILRFSAMNQGAGFSREGKSQGKVNALTWQMAAFAGIE